jgi:hypothetical protein
MSSEIIQVACVPIMCRNCDKFMGDISIKVKDVEEARIEGHRLREFLIKSGSFPVCDICCTTDTLDSQRLR